jgi:poly-gamma-glutamate capsule biosynthesis protein CapA/YwtB (metallophosphatase superfamily)
MADAERALLTAQKKLNALPAVFVAVGLQSALETMELSAEARALAGQVAAAELAVVAFHRKLTARAVELGIDLPAIGPLSGGR